MPARSGRFILSSICALIAVAGTLAGAPAIAADVLRVGSYPANPPWEFRNDAGEFEGFEVDLVREIAKRMDLEPEIEGLDFKALFVASASGRVDVVISSLTITEERLRNQSFTQPYFTGALGVAVLDESRIAGTADLKGKAVGSVATSFPEQWLKEREDELGYSSYASYDTTASMLLDLRTGRVDAVVNDIVGLRYAFTQTKGMKVIEEIVTGEKFAMMLPKDSSKLEAINDALSSMKGDGTMARIYGTWFGVEPASDSLTLTELPVPTSE